LDFEYKYTQALAINIIIRNMKYKYSIILFLLLTNLLHSQPKDYKTVFQTAYKSYMSNDFDNAIIGFNK
jgi:hypothetical protein